MKKKRLFFLQKTAFSETEKSRERGIEPCKYPAAVPPAHELSQLPAVEMPALLRNPVHVGQ